VPKTIKNPHKIIVKTEGGKKVGLGCQARIDLALGCTNACEACYARRVTYRGKDFYNPIERTYDEEKLRKTMKIAKLIEDIHIVRCGMVCDPGNHVDLLLKVLDVATDEKLRIIVSTKSLKYNKDVEKAMVDGGHILQVSLGMISKNAPTNDERIKVANKYSNTGIEVMFRIAEEMTSRPDKFYERFKGMDNVLLTPLRFTGKSLAEMYGADLDNYTYYKSFFRPDFVHIDWFAISKHVCGSLNKEDHCSNCLIEGGKKCQKKLVTS